MKPPSEDLELRQPVWDALSTLFLDTDVSLDRDYRVAVLAQSPYSLAELEEILVQEVYPVCSRNLLSFAGEWLGFDPAWLAERILERWRPARRSSPGRYLMRRSSEWRWTWSAVAERRAKLVFPP